MFYFVRGLLRSEAVMLTQSQREYRSARPFRLAVMIGKLDLQITAQHLQVFVHRWHMSLRSVYGLVLLGRFRFALLVLFVVLVLMVVFPGLLLLLRWFRFLLLLVFGGGLFRVLLFIIRFVFFGRFSGFVIFGVLCRFGVGSRRFGISGHRN